MSLKTLHRETFKTKLYSQFAMVGRAVANSRRLEILDLLSQGERTVEDLASEVGTSVSNISQHLQVLRAAGLVSSRKDGQYVHCSLSGDEVAVFWSAMRRLSVGLSSDLRELLEMYVDNRDQLEQIEQSELLERIRRGQTTVIDVRPAREYNAGHIPQAISIPLDTLESKLQDLPHSGEIVAYCRGPYCLLSVEAVEKLRASGFSVRRLADGFPEWRASGYPVEKSENG